MAVQPNCEGEAAGKQQQAAGQERCEQVQWRMEGGLLEEESSGQACSFR